MLKITRMKIINMKLSNVFSGIFSIYALFIATLMMLGGIIGGVWLLCIGQWPFVLGMLLFSYLSSIWLASLYLFPSMILARCAVFFERIKPLSFLFLGLSYLASATAIAGYVTVVFKNFFFDALSDAPSIPLLLMCFGTAVSPWAYMAQKELSLASTISALITQLSCLIISIILFLSTLSLMYIFLAVFVLQIISPLVLVLAGRKYSKDSINNI